jgi:hypothetical protein
VEFRVNIFGNRVLRRIFEPKREEVSEELRKLHNEQLHNLYSPPNIIKVIKLTRMKWSGHIVHMEEMRNVYKILVAKLQGKRPLERPRYR